MNQAMLKKLKQAMLKKLKTVFPEAVTETHNIVDGRVVIDYAIKPEFIEQLQGDLPSNDHNRYELMFPGKHLAKYHADTVINKALQPKPEESKNFDQTQNLYIEGDNIHALKLLRETYREKVKMIYIDPPYNTGSDGFVYNDDFSVDYQQYLQDTGVIDEQGKKLIEQTRDKLKGRKHAGWLAFMLPRLMIARDLLTDNGVIFISIDHNEQANLKLLCDEVFGINNFISQLIWRKKTGASDSSSFSIISESILVYTKSNDDLEYIFTKNQKSFDPKRYKLADQYINKRGNYYLDNLDRGGITYSDSMNYGVECPDGTITYPNGRTEFVNDGWIWTWGKEKLKWGIDNGFIVFKKSKKAQSGWKIYYKNYMYVNNKGDEVKRSAPHKNLILDIINTEGTAEINKIFPNAKVFKYPKPSELLKRLITYVHLDNNDIILDFFSGSGTTAHATMKLNADDGGNRQCIMVQLDEACNQQSEAYKNGYKTIPDIGKERIRRAEQEIRENIQTQIDQLRNKNNPSDQDLANAETMQQNLANTDFGFKNFKITDSVLQIDKKQQLGQLNQKQLDQFRVTITPENRLTVLTECLLRQCITLDQPVETKQTPSGYHYDLVDQKLFLVDAGLNPDVLDHALQMYGDCFDEVHYLLDALDQQTYFTSIEHLAEKAGKTVHRI